MNVSSIPSFSWRYSLCQPSSDYSPSYPLFYHEVFYLFLSCSSPAAVHRDGTTVWLSRSNNYQAAKRTKVCNVLSYGGVASLTSDIGPPLASAFAAGASGGTGKSKCCEQTETSANTHSVCAPRKLWDDYLGYIEWRHRLDSSTRWDHLPCGYSWWQHDLY